MIPHSRMYITKADSVAAMTGAINANVTLQIQFAAMIAILLFTAAGKASLA